LAGLNVAVPFWRVNYAVLRRHRSLLQDSKVIELLYGEVTDGMWLRMNSVVEG
jgi:hypothetical protein